MPRHVAESEKQMSYRDMYFNDLVNIMVNNNFSQEKIDDVIDKNNLHNIRWEIYSAIESKIHNDEGRITNAN